MTQLPYQPNALIGREAEVASLSGRVRRRDVQLLTLTGPGGVGKTRLAIAIGEAVREHFEDGVCFVDLSQLREAERVVPTIGQALGVREVGSRPILDLARDWLRDRQVLLVLDNFEQVLEAAFEIAQLLATCPEVKALATSREPLRVRAEHVHRVHPLATPTSSVENDLDALVLVPTVALFTERAQAADSSFLLNSRNAAPVAELCRRSDGLPLALELAAPHVRSLAPGDLLRRLTRDSSPALFARDAPARHRSLHAAIDWSYTRLDQEEQSVFRRLSVFAGGFTTESAAAVVGDGSDLEGCLAALVDKSLVSRDAEFANETRFRLLETIRGYARQRLVERSEGEAAQDMHAAFFLNLAERAESEPTGPRQVAWFDRLQSEHDNLRTALRWDIHSGRVESGLRLAGALWRFWWVRGYLHEGQRWLDEVLSSAAPSSLAARAKALNGAGNLAAQLREYDRSIALHEECLAMRREMRDRLGAAISLHNLALTVQYRGDYAAAIALSRQGLAESEAVEDRLGIGLAHLNLGECADYQGDLATARAQYEQSLVIMQELHDDARIARVLSGLARVAYAGGDPTRAVDLGREGLRRNLDAGDQPVAVACLEPLALALGDLNRHDQALRLLGAATSWRERNGIPRLPADVEPYDRAIRAAIAALGRRQAMAALAWGSGTSLVEVLAEALGDMDAAPRTLGPAGLLTRREKEVAALIARGYSNRQIAESLVIATSTAERHVANILGKLGLGSRAQIAVWAVENGSDAEVI